MHKRVHPVSVCPNSLSIYITFSVNATRASPQGNKNVVKIAIFALTHLLKHRITRKVFKIDRYMLQGVWQASNSFFIHGKYRVVVAAASPGRKQKCTLRYLKTAILFALAVRITGKLLQIKGYMLRGVWQTSNCLSIYGKYWVIVAGASPGETKMWSAVCENVDFLHLRFK